MQASSLLGESQQKSESIFYFLEEPDYEYANLVIAREAPEKAINYYNLENRR